MVLYWLTADLQVKCICIGPPYNTGSEDWVYGDSVSNPQMRGWLDRVVGADDPSRHEGRA